MINKIENYAITRWGFENRKTIAVFRLTSLFRDDRVWAAICFWAAAGTVAACFAILATK